MSAATFPMHAIAYADRASPPEYTCGDCGKGGVRLWREYQTFLDHQTLRCVACALANQKREADALHDGDQIGWLVPAVPSEDGETLWGYTSVPASGVDWWYALPCAVKVGRRENGAARS